MWKPIWQRPAPDWRGEKLNVPLLPTSWDRGVFGRQGSEPCPQARV